MTVYYTHDENGRPLMDCWFDSPRSAPEIWGYEVDDDTNIDVDSDPGDDQDELSEIDQDSICPWNNPRAYRLLELWGLRNHL